ncbi:VWA domain-containing protein [Agromyces sp. SYSU T00194]|uniref:VWA domain-containing protein n=1 Tax=Agromyces chitinivorans TaxID=3158560 RepID=UPI003392BC3A
MGGTVALVLLLLVGGTGAAWAAGILDPLLDGSIFASEPEGCDEPTELVVVADPTIEPVVTSVAETFDEASEGCAATTVRAQESADTAAVVATGTGEPADVWIPSAVAWVDRMSATATSLGRPAPEVSVGDAVASTPIVFVTPAEQAAEVGETQPGWGTVLAGATRMLLPDPEGSASSLAALGALAGIADPDDPTQLAGAMIELGKTIPASTEAALAATVAASEPTMAIATEQAVAAHNADHESEQLVAVYPAEGTPAMTFPFVRLGVGADDAETAAEDGAEDGADAAEATGAPEADATAEPDPDAWAPPTKDELLVDLEQAIAGAADVLAANGFRTADGGGELEAPGVVADAVATFDAPAGADQVNLLRQWGVLTLRGRMLAVIDVSGSMEDPAGNGLRRIDIFQQAALGAMEKFSGEVQMGVWAFSTARNGDLDYEELAPIASLADVAHLQQIAGIIASLPERLGGATGLYDTTLAAVQRVTETYDPDRVNSVLLITDGRNEDANGIDLDTLLAELEDLQDPLRPVPVIMIGFGPDTDLDAMTKIAKVTGGAAYSASEPEDLGQVLVTALSQRTCRPDCG